MWEYLEGEIRGKEFFSGDSFSIAEITSASIHVNLYLAVVDIDKNRFPAFADFIQRMFARPSFKNLIDEESPMWSRRGGA